MITRKQLIEKYIKFFESKGHKRIENSSLVPKEDPSVLFTTAGMHPLVPYLLGQKHPLGKNLVSLQKCIRTGDIDEVGDETHHTFFEMLGNWSLGNYWKKEAIEFSFQFLTKELKIPKEKLAVTIFAGDKTTKRDTESEKIWKSLGINKITPLGKEDNWWGPAGTTGPCGPDTEMFYWKDKSNKVPEEFNPNDSTLATGGNKWVEIWNDVFMEYIKDENGKYLPAKQKNVDTGMGVERTLAILNGTTDNYQTEVWKPIIQKIEELSKRKYNDHKKTMRIIADHIKASVFILAEEIIPSNKEQGYVLRRLIRRAIINLRKLGLTDQNLINPIAEKVFETYSDYKDIHKKREFIYNEINREEEKFEKTLEKGLSLFDNITKKKKRISGENVFLLYQSYGFPLEMTKELAEEKNINIDEKSFFKKLEEHQKLSQTASAGKFKSGLADNSEQTTKLHTATHLLLTALRQVLKNKNIFQKGSNITPERLRLDFNFERKLTESELKQIENLVNEQIKKSLEIKREEMNLEQAKKSGAIGSFEEKYGKIVSIYSIGNFSKEFCSGPHAKNTKDIGKFKIIKEESVSAGVRRIKAVLE
ncbi:MAG: alanine--tRNA ligase [Nanoarchaeota archaeon]